jgi:hypothetical protein
METLKPFLKTMDTKVGLLIIVAIAAGLLWVIHLLLRRSTRPAIKQYVGMFTIVAGIVLFAIVFLVFSFGFASRGEVPASVVPQLWIFLLLVCCAILVVSALRGNQEEDPAPGHQFLPFVFIGIVIAYIILIILIGFYISSFLFVVAGVRVLGYRRWPVIIALATGWVVFSYGIFYKLLYVPLPEGLLFQMLAR